MRFVVLLILISCSVTVFAQTPGYMGKRFGAGYGAYASPGYIGSAGATPVNIQHEAFVEFVTKKRFSIGLSVKAYKAIYANTRYVNVLDNNASSNDQIDKHPSGVTNIRAKNYMLYFKFFGKHYLAPWGRYFIMGATLNTFNSTYDPDHMNVGTESSPSYSNGYTHSGYVSYSDFGPAKQSFKKFDVMIGWGRSRIVADRITIDYGFNVNLWAFTATVFDAPDDDIGEKILLPDKYIGTISAARIRGVNRFNIFCKIGILLF